MKKTLGAFFQAYKNPKSTEYVIQQFLKHFKDSPIFLISDGGEDFSEMAKKYGCGYIFSENIYGNEINNYSMYGYNSYRIKEAWKRHKMTVEHCKTDYIIILEDDVFTNQNFEIIKDFDLCGVQGPPLSESIKNIIKQSQGNNVDFYGMCGGSIYNSKIFLKIYDDVIQDIEKNHDLLMGDSQNFQLGAFDANLVFHFAKRGYTYEKSQWLSQMSDGGNFMDYPLIHYNFTHTPIPIP